MLGFLKKKFSPKPYRRKMEDHHISHQKLLNQLKKISVGSSTGVFDLLPKDILCYITQFLPLMALSLLSRTCSKWALINEEQNIWKMRAIEEELANESQYKDCWRCRVREAMDTPRFNLSDSKMSTSPYIASRAQDWQSIITFSNNNRTMLTHSGGWHSVRVGEILLTKGVYKFHFKIDSWTENGAMIGIVKDTFECGIGAGRGYAGQGCEGISVDEVCGSSYYNAYGNYWVKGDVISARINMESRKVEWFRNGVFSGDSKILAGNLKVIISYCNGNHGISIVQNMPKKQKRTQHLL